MLGVVRSNTFDRAALECNFDDEIQIGLKPFDLVGSALKKVRRFHLAAVAEMPRPSR